jgi:predicted alpha/beta hydrolase
LTELTLFRTGDPTDPVVVFLPAMGVDARYYEVLADTLAEYGFNTVLADLRGNGHSSVRASRRVSFGYAEILELELPAIVESVCQEFGSNQIIMLGHSLGGQLGLLFATTSTRVGQVILIASGSSWYRVMPGMRSVGRFLGLQLIFGTTLLRGYLPERFPFAGREARHLILDWGFEAMTGRYRVVHSSVDYEKALSESTVPALFLSFPADSYVPDPCVDLLATKLGTAKVTRRAIPAELLRLAKSDHFRWALRPQAVVEAVAEWVRTAP